MSDQAAQAHHDPQSQPNSPGAGPQTRLRLWPGVVLVAVFWLVRVWATTGEFALYKFFVGMLIAPLVVLAGLALWWLLASRLRWCDRLLVVGTFVAVTAVAMVSADASFRGMALVLYALPVVITAWLGWLLLSFRLPWPVRRTGVLLIFIAASVGCSLLRIDGMDGNFVAKFNWRWTPTPEEKLLAELKSKPARQSDVQPAALPGAAGLSEQPGDWPGFRGPRRDGRLSAAAAGIVAASHRSRLVVVRRGWRPALHAGTAGRRRICRLLRRGHGGGNMGPSRCDAVLRTGRGSRSARDTHVPRRAAVLVRGQRSSELPGCGQRPAPLAARCRGRFRSRRPAMGLRQFAAGDSRRGGGVRRRPQRKDGGCL